METLKKLLSIKHVKEIWSFLIKRNQPNKTTMEMSMWDSIKIFCYVNNLTYRCPLEIDAKARRLKWHTGIRKVGLWYCALFFGIFAMGVFPPIYVFCRRIWFPMPVETVSDYNLLVLLVAAVTNINVFLVGLLINKYGPDAVAGYNELTRFFEILQKGK